MPIKTIDEMSADLRKQAEIKNKPKLFSVYDTLNNIPAPKANFVGEKIDINDKYAVVGNKYIPKYDKGYISGMDNNEFYAQNQTNWEQIRNGLSKTALKGTAYVADATIGFVAGAYNGFKEGSVQGFVNNDFSKWIDETNKKLDYQLPNYYTREQQNMGLLKQATTLNFWFNDVGNAAAFMIGAVGSEAIWAAATGGSSLALSGAKAGLRLGSKALVKSGLGVVDDALKAQGKKALNAYARTISTKTDDVANLATNTIIGKQIAGGLNNARFLMTSAGFEAGVEARASIDENIEQFKQYKLETEGRLPTIEEYKEVMPDIASTSNKVFGTNMAILGVSNVLQFAQFAGIGKTGLGRIVSKTGDLIDNKILGKGIVRTADGAAEAIKANKLQRVIGRQVSYWKNPITEGLEEGLQGVTQGYFGSSLEGRFNPESMQATMSSMDILKESMANTFTTQEGLKEVFIGAIVGKLGGFSGGIKAGLSELKGTYGEQQKQLEKLAKDYTKVANLTQPAKDAINRALLFNKQQTSSRNAVEAKERGDDNVATMEFSSAAAAKFQAEQNAGLLEDSVENFTYMVNNFKNEDFIKEMGVEESEIQETKERLIEEYKQQAEVFKKAHKYAEALSPKINGKRGLKEQHFVEEVAHNYFMGAQAIQRVKNLGIAIEEATGQNGFADLAAYYTTLDKSQKKVVKSLDKAKNEIKSIDNEYAQLQQEYSTLLEKAKRVEENTALNKQIETNRTKAEKLESKKRDLEAQKTELERQVDVNPLKNKYTFGNIFEGDFINLDRVVDSVEALKKLDQHLVELRKIDVNKATALESLIQDYKISHQYVENFNKAVQDMSSGAFNIKQYKGIQKLFTNPKKYHTPKEITDENSQIELDIKANGLDEYEAFQYRVLMEMSEQMKNENFIEFDFNEEISNEEWETFKEKSEVTSETKSKIAEKVFNKIGLTNREQRIYDKLTDDINLEVSLLKKNKGDSIRKRITQITDNPQLKTNIEKLKDQINQIKESKNYLDNLVTENVSQKDIPTEEEYREYNKLKSKEKLSPKKQARFDELKTKITNWGAIEGSSLSGLNLADLYEQLFALETITEEETEVEDFKEIVEEDDIISGETLEAQEQRWYYNILQYYDKAFIQPIVRMVNGKQVPGVTLHNIGIENVLEQLVSINGLTKVAIDGKIMTATEALKKTIKKSATVFYEKDGVEQRIDLGLNETKNGYGIYTTVMEDSIKRINEDSNLQIMSTTFQQNQPTVYKTLYKKLEDGTLVIIESPFERRGSSAEVSKTQSIKDGQEVSAKVNLGNKYNQELIKKLRKGDITLEDFKMEMVVEMVTSDRVLAGELKSEKQGDQASTHLTKFQELRQQVLDAVMEDVNNDIENLGEQIVYADNATSKVKGVYLGHPILEMRKVSENKVEVKQHQITDIEKIADTGYIENGEIKLRGKGAKDKIKKTFVHSILKGSKKFEGKRTPIVILNFRGKLVAYPISLQPTKQNLSSELQDIYNNENTTVTQKVIAINNLLNSVNLNPNTLGVTSQNYIQKAEELDKILSDINVYPKVETFVDENLPLEEILQGNVTINIDLQGDMFHSPKVVLDFGKEKDEETTDVEQQAEEYEETGEVYEETTLETQTIENQEETTNEEINTENETINTENTPQPEPLQAEDIQENELVEPESEINSFRDVDFTAKGGNKVVDEKGEPITVFTGTNANSIEDIDSLYFENDKTLKDKLSDLAPNYQIFFTDNKKEAQSFGKNVFEANVLIKNPVKNKSDLLKTKSDLIKQGYDGYIWESKDGRTHYIVFDKAQIKSESLLSKEQPTSTTPYIESKAIFSTYDNNGNPIEKIGIIKNIEYNVNGNTDTITLEFEGGETQTIKNYTNNFLPNALKFENNVVPLQTDMNVKQETLLNNSLEQYNNSTEQQKKELVLEVKKQLSIDEKGKETIGMGLDEDMVAAGKEFLKVVENPVLSDVESIEKEFTKEEDDKIKAISIDANNNIQKYIKSVPTGRKDRFSNNINEFEATNPFTQEKVIFKRQSAAVNYVIEEIAKAITKSGREQIFKKLQSQLRQEVKQSTQPNIDIPQSVITKAKEEQNKKCKK